MGELLCHHNCSGSAGSCWIPWPGQVNLHCWAPCSDCTRDKFLGISPCMRLEVRLARGLLTTRGSVHYWEGENQVIGGQIVASDQTALGIIQLKPPYILVWVFPRLVKSELLASVNIAKKIRLQAVTNYCFGASIFQGSQKRNIILYCQYVSVWLCMQGPNP